jgi:hypothetical protein
MFRFFAAALVLSFGFAQSSLAVTYNYNFVAEFASINGNDGVANSSTSDIAGGFSTLTGTVTLDDTPASAVSGGGSGAKGYYAAPVLTINEFTSGFLEAPDRTVVENGTTSLDQLFFGYSNPVGATYDRVDMILRDNTGTVFSSTDLPTSLDLADFNIEILFFYSTTADGFERRDFNIVSLTPAIPIPAAVWLFSSGLIGLIGVARRKKT